MKNILIRARMFLFIRSYKDCMENPIDPKLKNGATYYLMIRSVWREPTYHYPPEALRYLFRVVPLFRAIARKYLKGIMI